MIALVAMARDEVMVDAGKGVHQADHDEGKATRHNQSGVEVDGGRSADHYRGKERTNHNRSITAKGRHLTSATALPWRPTTS